MFNIKKINNDRVDIDLSGSIETKDMEAALDQLVSATQDMKNGQMLYTITDFKFPTFGALMVEFSRLPKLFGLVGKIDRCALVCDTTWIRKAAELEGLVIPGLTIKSFGLDEVGRAEEWLMEKVAA